MCQPPSPWGNIETWQTQDTIRPDYQIYLFVCLFVCYFRTKGLKAKRRRMNNKLKSTSLTWRKFKQKIRCTCDMFKQCCINILVCFRIMKVNIALQKGICNRMSNRRRRRSHWDKLNYQVKDVMWVSVNSLWEQVYFGLSFIIFGGWNKQDVLKGWGVQKPWLCIVTAV